MVGTKPTPSPACRQAIACSCMAIADSITIGLAGGVLVLRSRERAVSNVLVKLPSRRLDRIAEPGVLADEFRDVVRGEPEDVLDDEHLGIALRSSANADRGNRKRFGHSLAEHARDALQDDGERARLFEGLRIVEDLLRRLVAAALDPVATELADNGGRQAEVR